MLGRFPRLRTRLDEFSGLRLRRSLQRFPKTRRYVKLDHLCHDNLLDLIPSVSRLRSAFKLQSPYQVHPHRQRTESHNRNLRKSPLHTAHDLIHMVLLQMVLPQVLCGNRLRPFFRLSQATHTVRKHRSGQYFHIWIPRIGSPEQFLACVLMSEPAPHHSAKKHIVAVHPGLPFNQRLETSIAFQLLAFCRAWRELLEHLRDTFVQVLFIFLSFAGQGVLSAAAPNQLLGFCVVHVDDQGSLFVILFGCRRLAEPSAPESSPAPSPTEAVIEGLK